MFRFSGSDNGREAAFGGPALPNRLRVQNWSRNDGILSKSETRGPFSHDVRAILRLIQLRAMDGPLCCVALKTFQCNCCPGGPGSAEFGQTPVEFGPNSVNIGRNLVESGPDSANSASEIDTLLRDSGPS